LKFTEHGGVTIEVSYKNSIIYFKVIDTGYGIKEEDRGKIF